MEVHVRNVPKQVSETILEKYFKSHLAALSITSALWKKIYDKTRASIVFLHRSDGEKFLQKHGQVRTERKFQPAKMPLKFQSQPIYFEESSHAPDESCLRVLAEREKNRGTKPQTTDESVKIDKFETVNLASTTFSCGTWSYMANELIFVPEVRWKSGGTAKFGQRSLMMTMAAQYRIDFRYTAILDILVQKSPESITISMKEPARFFEHVTIRQQERGRSRIPSLCFGHEAIAGHCLVYRIDLVQMDAKEFNDKLKKLQRISLLPQISNHKIRVRDKSQNLAESLSFFNECLKSPSLGLPFEVLFQIQQLVQNNYLLPMSVTRLLPEIRSMLKRSGLSTCVNAIKMLFTQINYPSLEVDGMAFQHENLLALLKENERLSAMECSYEVDFGAVAYVDEKTPISNANQNNEIMIHRVRITPAGLFLSGPEAESNNRVLRKYSDHHSYFLRVTLGDEDGGSIRQSAKVSHEKIFHGRFAKVLTDGIEVAGRHYYFLGLSHSSLRMQTCWMVAPFISQGSLMDERQIIRDLGDFSSIQCPAKCAARIGQAFSDTPDTLKIKSHNVIEDVTRNGRVFSDGVGTISRDICDQIYENCRRKHEIRPTCYQIRYQGMTIHFAIWQDGTLAQVGRHY